VDKTSLYANYCLVANLALHSISPTYIKVFIYQSTEWHHTTCVHPGGRPKSNHGQTMAERFERSTETINNRMYFEHHSICQTDNRSRSDARTETRGLVHTCRYTYNYTSTVHSCTVKCRNNSNRSTDNYFNGCTGIMCQDR